MALPPLPENNTKRYFLNYQCGGIGHALQSRCSDAMGDATAVDNFTAFVTAILDAMGSNTTFLSVDVALKGSDIRNPVPGWDVLVGTAGGVTGLDLPRSMCFPGRSVTGRKTRLFLFGVTSALVTPTTWAFDPITNPELGAGRALLNSQSDFWCAIDGVKAIWKSRLTVKPNDHYVDKARPA